MMILPIVEGQSEIASVPILLRRIFEALEIWDVQVGRPLRCPRQKIVRESDLKRMLALANGEGTTQAILILFDLDDDCARNLIPSITQWCEEMATDLPHAIVLARREYEAWFLASVESLRGKCGILPTATYEADPEAKRGAKGALELLIPKNRGYDEVADQPVLTAVFDMQMAYKRSSSFRKLVSELCRVLIARGYQPTIPEYWISV
jgi:hypothetical protein